MNTEDFVTYEQSITLKKLGFNEKCLFYYGPDKVLYPNYTFSTDILRITDLYCSCNDSTNNYPIDDPTLAQVQKWLRKEKNLYVYADGAVFDKNYEKPSYYPCILDVISEHDKIGISDFNHYLTPEEALSAGITECIKILKEN